MTANIYRIYIKNHEFDGSPDYEDETEANTKAEAAIYFAHAINRQASFPEGESSVSPSELLPHIEKVVW